MRLNAQVVLILSLLLVALCVSTACNAEVFRMKDGKVYRGKIVAQSEDRYIVRLFSGGTVTLEKKDVERIDKDEVAENTWLWREAVDNFFLKAVEPNEQAADLFGAIHRQLTGLDFLKVEMYAEKRWNRTLSDQVGFLFSQCANDHGGRPVIDCPACAGRGCTKCNNQGKTFCPFCVALELKYLDFRQRQEKAFQGLAVLTIHIGDLPREKFAVLEKILLESRDTAYFAAPPGKYDGGELPGHREFRVLIPNPISLDELSGTISRWSETIVCKFESPKVTFVPGPQDKSTVSRYETRFYIDQPLTASVAAQSYTKSGHVLGRKVDYGIGMSALLSDGKMTVYPGIEHLRDTLFAPLVTVNLKNRDSIIETLFVSFMIEGVTERVDKTLTVAPGEEAWLTISPAFPKAVLTGNSALPARAKAWIRPQFEITTAALVLDEPIVVESAFQVPLLPDGQGGMSVLLAGAWVTPDDTGRKVLSLVEEIAKAKGFEFTGYQGTDKDGPLPLLAQLMQIWAYLQEHEYKYLNTTIGRFDTQGTSAKWWTVLESQRVRSPAEVIDAKAGNCIELSLLFASILEAIGLEPVLVQLPGHFMVGVVLKDRLAGTPVSKSDIFFFESTLISTSSLLVSYKSAEAKLRKWKYVGDPSVQVFLVKDMRDKGIKPCPWF
ncbi:MAG: transglutaminase family protein [Candidatus Brocadiia bacterium]